MIDKLEATARELLAQGDGPSGSVNFMTCRSAEHTFKMRDCIATLLEDRAALQVRCEAAEKDAGRYKWLRNVSAPGMCAFYLAVSEDYKDVKFAPQTVDKAIDAAIAKGAAHEP